MSGLTFACATSPAAPPSCILPGLLPDTALAFSRSCPNPRIRACPWQPLFVFTFKRVLFALRACDPQDVPLLHEPPAIRAIASNAKAMSFIPQFQKNFKNTAAR